MTERILGYHIALRSALEQLSLLRVEGEQDTLIRHSRPTSTPVPPRQFKGRAQKSHSMLILFFTFQQLKRRLSQPGEPAWRRSGILKQTFNILQATQMCIMLSVNLSGHMEHEDTMKNLHIKQHWRSKCPEGRFRSSSSVRTHRTL